MKLGVNVSHLDAVDTAREAERLGYDLVVVPEGFRADGATVLGAVATATSRIGIASGVLQIPARTPATTALTAATLDALSHGRFRLGLGVSNPDISEGWHGVAFDHPLGRTREYVEIVRRALSGERVVHRGEHFRVPLPGRTDHPLVLHTDPAHDRVPVYLAAVGPRNKELAGEIADGWLGAFAPPDDLPDTLVSLRAGRERAGRGLDGFEVLCGVPVVVGADVESSADPVRGYLAHFLGMGDPRRNVYSGLVRRMGYGQAVADVHAHVAANDQRAAATAVPTELVDRVSLLGPPERIAERVRAYTACGITTLVVSPFARTTAERLDILRTVAGALDRTGAGV
ncbi:LLM class flavin-dependent oxidoreductase [Actinosynnema sp. CS-041913]|uniref:LLM class flavin-dependent oxidoreductase n=1 Tax=Actinosynnema sp. CS-041913 TaxID=3239917 RepID=UPI003D8BD663